MICKDQPSKQAKLNYAIYMYNVTALEVSVATPHIANLLGVQQLGSKPGLKINLV